MRLHQSFLQLDVYKKVLIFLLLLFIHHSSHSYIPSSLPYKYYNSPSPPITNKPPPWSLFLQLHFSWLRSWPCQVNLQPPLMTGARGTSWKRVERRRMNSVQDSWVGLKIIRLFHSFYLHIMINDTDDGGFEQDIAPIPSSAAITASAHDAQGILPP